MDVLINKYKADPKRIFVSGISNGAIMSYRLACELSDRLAGAAIFAGGLGMKNVDSQDCKGIEI
jgi:polyhydroxybutyrate depolymerase